MKQISIAEKELWHYRQRQLVMPLRDNLYQHTDCDFLSNDTAIITLRLRDAISQEVHFQMGSPPFRSFP